MKATISHKETLQSGPYKDTLEKRTVEFEDRPTLDQIKAAALAGYFIWDAEDSLPEGAAFIRHIYGIKMKRMVTRYEVEILINDPFND